MAMKTESAFLYDDSSEALWADTATEIYQNQQKRCTDSRAASGYRLIYREIRVFCEHAATAAREPSWTEPCTSTNSPPRSSCDSILVCSRLCLREQNPYEPARRLLVRVFWHQNCRGNSRKPATGAKRKHTPSPPMPGHAPCERAWHSHCLLPATSRSPLVSIGSGCPASLLRDFFSGLHRPISSTF